MDHEEFYIPRHLDEPPRFLFWTYDELFAVAIPLGWAFLAGHPWGGLAGAVSSFWLIRRVKRGGGARRLQHAMYWLLPNFIGLKTLPPSYVRRWYG